MIRRIAVTLLFAVLGLANLLLVDDVLSWLCAHFSGVCHSYAGPCPGIDTCRPGKLMNLALTAIYFGPPLVFAVAGFLFSKKKRRPAAWAFLLVGLVATHIAVMFVVMQSTGHSSL